MKHYTFNLELKSGNYNNEILIDTINSEFKKISNEIKKETPEGFTFLESPANLSIDPESSKLKISLGPGYTFNCHEGLINLIKLDKKKLSVLDNSTYDL